MAQTLQADCRVDDQSLCAANAQVRVQEDDVALLDAGMRHGEGDGRGLLASFTSGVDVLPSIVVPRNCQVSMTLDLADSPFSMLA